MRAVDYVIVGHSERRQHFGDTDESVNRKLTAVIAAGLIPILCVGETQAEREADQTLPVVRRQLEGGLGTLKPATGTDLVIAYEPVWAIGTGLTATPEQAQTVHHFIRSLLREFLRAAGRSHPHPVRRQRHPGQRRHPPGPAGYRRRPGGRRLPQTRVVPADYQSRRVRGMR